MLGIFHNKNSKISKVIGGIDHLQNSIWNLQFLVFVFTVAKSTLSKTKDIDAAYKVAIWVHQRASIVFLLEMPIFPFQSEIGNVRDSYRTPPRSHVRFPFPYFKGFLSLETSLEYSQPTSKKTPRNCKLLQWTRSNWNNRSPKTEPLGMAGNTL